LDIQQQFLSYSGADAGQSERVDVPPYGSININVIAPRVPGIFQQVDYEFALTGPANASLVSFRVIVINSFFVQIFNPFTILLIIIGVVTVAVVIVIVRRRKSTKKT